MEAQRNMREYSTGPMKENEIDREERQEVVVVHSTAETGEAATGRPCGGKGPSETKNRQRETQPGTQMTDPTGNVSTKQRRIAEIARNYPDISLTNLVHYMDEAWLLEAYRLTRKDGAAGIDKQTAMDYAKNLDQNLKELLDRTKSGRYRAPAVRRVYIPKPGSKETRPIGIPTFEDKILQRAVTMLLEPVYEQEFHHGSFGFRPGHSQHQALHYLREGMMRMKGGWIIDLDIRKFFDTLDHGKLREILAKRVNDRVITRIVGKWMNAGVMEKGELSYNETGTPQGGVISPLLSNIYLHEVLDSWFERDVKPRMSGQCFLVRYADDAVLCFEHRKDAERVMRVLPKRFEKYGLMVHPEKTKLIDMKRPSREFRRKRGSFTFLGFKHYWGKSLKGNWVIFRKTDNGRFSRSLRSIKEWIRENRHTTIKYMHEILSRKLLGYYGYYGISGNIRCLSNFMDEVKRIWEKWLKRRSNKRNLNWDKFQIIYKRYPLPRPRVIHSWV
jgi:group II intron reverse transcriptase/maturase